MRAVPLTLVLLVSVIAIAQAQPSTDHEYTAFTEIALKRQINDVYSLQSLGRFFQKVGRKLAKIGRIIQFVGESLQKAGNLLAGDNKYSDPRLVLQRLSRKLEEGTDPSTDEGLSRKVVAAVLAETAVNSNVSGKALKTHLVSRLREVSTYLIKEGEHFESAAEDPVKEMDIGLQIVMQIVERPED